MIEWFQLQNKFITEFKSTGTIIRNQLISESRVNNIVEKFPQLCLGDNCHSAASGTGCTLNIFQHLYYFLPLKQLIMVVF